MRIDLFTLFPDWFGGVFGDSILKRAREKGLLDIRVHDFREWTRDRHRSVDDSPYGGGAGMVIRPEPLAATLDEVCGAPGSPERPYVLLTSPSGTTFTQRRAEEFARLPRIAVVCGHYEAVDQRLIDTRIDEEISIGDFVLTGGEIPAMAIVDAVARLVPGVLHNDQSAVEESFSSGLLEGPHFTRPEVFEGLRVPDVLRSGDHARIAKWRRAEALRKTRARRPDLLPPSERDNPDEVRWE